MKCVDEQKQQIIKPYKKNDTPIFLETAWRWFLFSLQSSSSDLNFSSSSSLSFGGLHPCSLCTNHISAFYPHPLASRFNNPFSFIHILNLYRHQTPPSDLKLFISSSRPPVAPSSLGFCFHLLFQPAHLLLLRWCLPVSFFHFASFIASSLLLNSFSPASLFLFFCALLLWVFPRKVS